MNQRLGHNGFYSVYNIWFIAEGGSLQALRVGHGYIGAIHMLNRRIPVIEGIFVNQRSQPLACPIVFPSLLGNDDAIGLLHRVNNEVDIDGADAPEIYHFCLNTFFSQVFSGLYYDMQYTRKGNNRHMLALA